MRLEQFVQVVPQPEPDHIIIERLSQIADVDLTKAVVIIGRMVEGDKENWRITGWQEEAKSILAKGM